MWYTPKTHTPEVEVEGLRVWSQPGVHRKTRLKEKQTEEARKDKRREGRKGLIYFSVPLARDVVEVQTDCT